MMGCCIAQGSDVVVKHAWWSRCWCVMHGVVLESSAPGLGFRSSSTGIAEESGWWGVLRPAEHFLILYMPTLLRLQERSVAADQRTYDVAREHLTPQGGSNGSQEGKEGREAAGE